MLHKNNDFSEICVKKIDVSFFPSRGVIFAVILYVENNLCDKCIFLKFRHPPFTVTLLRPRVDLPHADFNFACRNILGINQLPCPLLHLEVTPSQ